MNGYKMTMDMNKDEEFMYVSSANVAIPDSVGSFFIEKNQKIHLRNVCRLA